MTRAEGVPIVEPTHVLELQLAETDVWVALRGYALDGIRMALAIEMSAIDIEKKLENETLAARVAVREARITELRRYQERCERWSPLDPNQIPRRKS